MQLLHCRNEVASVAAHWVCMNAPLVAEAKLHYNQKQLIAIEVSFSPTADYLVK